MRVGENPHKVYNIVYTQMDAFRSIYKPIIEDLPNVNYLPDGTIEVAEPPLCFLTLMHSLLKPSFSSQQDFNVRLRASLAQKLPKHVHDKLYNYHRWYVARTEKIKELNLEEPQLSQSIVASPELPRYIESSRCSQLVELHR